MYNFYTRSSWFEHVELLISTKQWNDIYSKRLDDDFEFYRQIINFWLKIMWIQWYWDILPWNCPMFVYFWRICWFELHGLRCKAKFVLFEAFPNGDYYHEVVAQLKCFISQCFRSKSIPKHVKMLFLCHLTASPRKKTREQYNLMNTKNDKFSLVCGKTDRHNVALQYVQTLFSSIFELVFAASISLCRTSTIGPLEFVCPKRKCYALEYAARTDHVHGHTVRCGNGTTAQRLE